MEFLKVEGLKSRFSEERQLKSEQKLLKGVRMKDRFSVGKKQKSKNFLKLLD